MRRGIDGLAAIVQQNYALNPYSGKPISVLRKTQRPSESTAVGGRRLCAAVQAFEWWKLPVAAAARSSAQS